jgi:hypothetical protein
MSRVRASLWNYRRSVALDVTPLVRPVDLQVLRPVSIPIRDRHLKARVGFSVFNLFDHFNPRDVQTISESSRFGQFFNDAWREYRGKFVIEF